MLRTRNRLELVVLYMYVVSCCTLSLMRPRHLWTMSLSNIVKRFSARSRCFRLGALMKERSFIDDSLFRLNLSVCKLGIVTFRWLKSKELIRSIVPDKSGSLRWKHTQRSFRNMTPNNFDNVLFPKSTVSDIGFTFKFGNKIQSGA